MSDLKKQIEQAMGMIVDAKAILFNAVNKIEPTPRPLSKGDWVYDHNVLFGLVTYCSRSNSVARLIYMDGFSGSSNISNLTRIDTLTEEHLKMLDNEETRWRIIDNRQCGGALMMSATNIVSNRIIIQYNFYDSVPKHEAISECLKSVIARRRLDREMGV